MFSRCIHCSNLTNLFPRKSRTRITLTRYHFTFLLFPFVCVFLTVHRVATTTSRSAPFNCTTFASVSMWSCFLHVSCNFFRKWMSSSTTFTTTCEICTPPIIVTCFQNSNKINLKIKRGFLSRVTNTILRCSGCHSCFLAMFTQYVFRSRKRMRLSSPIPT